jgi:hypothetical protein
MRVLPPVSRDYLPPPGRTYSQRKATIGSTFVARRAGM